MSLPPRTRPGLKLLPLAALTLIAVAACAPVSAGAAAVVGKQRLTTTSLQTSVRQLLAEGGGGGQPTDQLLRNTVDRWVYEQLIDRVARARGVTVTAGDIAAKAAQVKAQGGEAGYRQAVIASGAPFADADELVRLVVQLQRLGVQLVPGSASADPTALANARQAAIDKLVIAEAGKVDVDVSPRYGQFDPASATVAPLQSGGLAVDAQTYQQMK